MTKELLILETKCPRCHQELNEGTKIPLDIQIIEHSKAGVLKLSAIFGDYEIDSDIDIPEGSLVNFKCPKCEESLVIENKCELCAAPMVSLELKNGGHIDFCSRRGCKGHALGGCGDVNEMIKLMNQMLNTPFE